MTSTSSRSPECPAPGRTPLRLVALLALVLSLVLAAGCGQQDPVAPAPATADTKATARTGVGAVSVSPDSVLAATFTVAWSEPAVLPLAPPVVGYAVAIDATGPVSLTTWRRTTHVLETVPAGGRQYARTYGPGATGVPAGAAAWLTVVPVFQGGALGAIGGSVAFRATDGFVLAGRVISDQGDPLADVDVTIPACGLVARTDADGAFRFAPLVAGRTFTLRTESGAGWHDYTTLPLGAADAAPVICLVSRQQLQYPVANLDYLHAFASISKWFWHNVGATRPLLRWEHFPLRVHIAAGLNANGTVDIDAIAREQLAYLNAACGRQLWVETADSTAAQVLVRCFNMSGAYGRVYLNPDQTNPVWGNTPPRWMRLVVAPVLTTEDAYRRMLNHELGHSLYIGSHSTNMAHLMNYQGGFDPGVPTDDDLRIFRAIATIPLGTDLNRYEE